MRPLGRRQLFSVALAVVLGTSAAGAAEPLVERYSGIARSPSGELLYREQHEVVEREGIPVRAVTTYYDRDGKKLGELDSDFSRSAFAPNYDFQDLRAHKRESAQVLSGAVLLSYAGERKKLEVPSGETLVLGQGLHHFARLNLDRLALGPVSVRFAVPSRLDTYSFRIRPMEGTDARRVRLRIEIDSWLLRQFAPHIEVLYDRQTRHLLEYRGVSNLEAPDGSTQKVVIQYAYPAARDSGASARR